MKKGEADHSLAQSASAIGAAILGFGLGARWGNLVSRYVLMIIVTGGILHIAGMYIIRIQKRGQIHSYIETVLWISACICLLAIAGIILFLILKK